MNILVPKILYLFASQLWLVSVTVEAKNMPPDLAMRVRESNIDGSCVKPVPITDEVYEEIINGPQPGSICDGLPCHVPYEDWYCALCNSLLPYCLHTAFGNSPFCGWCIDEGCSVTSIPPNTSEDYPEYGVFEYVAGPFPDPK
ncbi:uncharacterized protein [Macrobrachium rosenbergii]|uniref:uncharacterized protein n=1 Tax=Macrobrachium rosenbergii TaxID=79674 RepID=UPI0034D4CDB2